MTPKPKALVVEDDLGVVEFIKRTMTVLRHDCRAATNLADAREALEAEDYAYVILDLKIPPLPDGLFPDLQCGYTFLQEIQQAKGSGTVPVIAMTTQTAEAFGLAVELIKMGATKCIAKPLDDPNKPLAKVIQDVLAEHKAKLNGGPPHGCVDPAEPVTLDEFMERLCVHVPRKTRRFRREALLGAARNKTLKMPELAVSRKPGQANRYRIGDLLAAWPGLQDRVADLPALRPDAPKAPPVAVPERPRNAVQARPRPK